MVTGFQGRHFAASFCFLLATLVPLQQSAAQEGQTAEQTEQPRLVIAEPVFNFATVKQGARVEHAFRISNAGDADLKITKTHPACGCTVANLEKPVLAPGESTDIKVVFDTAGFRGEKTKTVRIYTNDPQQSSAVVTMQGTVQATIQITPEVVQFGNILHGKRQVAEVEMLAEPDSKVILKEVESRSPELEVSSTDITKDGLKGKKIVLTLKETLPIGPFRSRVVVKTSSEQTPIVSVPVLANVEGDLQLNPSTVSFGLLQGPLPKPVYKTVMLNNRGAGSVRLQSLRSEGEGVTAEFSTLEEGKRYAIKIGITEKVSGVVRGSVRIVTDHPEQPQRELVLPVYAIINRGSE